MGSAPQQAGSPMSSGSPFMQRVNSAFNTPMMQSMQSGMAPSPQPQSTSTMGISAPPGISTMGTNAPQGTPNMAPITQQLQQATQPGSNYVGPMQQSGGISTSGIGAPGDSYVGQMQQQQNPLVTMLNAWGL